MTEEQMHVVVTSISNIMTSNNANLGEVLELLRKCDIEVEQIEIQSL